MAAAVKDMGDALFGMNPTLSKKKKGRLPHVASFTLRLIEIMSDVICNILYVTKDTCYGVKAPALTRILRKKRPILSTCTSPKYAYVVFSTDYVNQAKHNTIYLNHVVTNWSKF